MNRPSRAVINLAALRHNYGIARRLHGGRALAVVKADAYGHGAIRCAKALEQTADGFAVAFLEEALELRAAGIRSPILLLEGVFGASQLREVHANDLWIVVHHEDQLHMVIQDESPKSLHVWLKGDSGMHRLGFPLHKLKDAHRRLSQSGKASDITLMTHFARADAPQSVTTLSQIEAFDQATDGLYGDRSLCNSAGVLGWPLARRDWARPGIMLYGVRPMPTPPVSDGLKAVMSFESQVFATKILEPGEALGYGGTFVAEATMRVGLVAVGYADGYPRAAMSGTPVIVDGARTRILGRVSMDILAVDLSALPTSGSASLVELWGSQLDVSEVAMHANTIPYELLCHVKRVPKLFRDGRTGHL